MDVYIAQDYAKIRRCERNTSKQNRDGQRFSRVNEYITAVEYEKQILPPDDKKNLCSSAVNKMVSTSARSDRSSDVGVCSIFKEYILFDCFTPWTCLFLTYCKSQRFYNCTQQFLGSYRIGSTHNSFRSDRSRRLLYLLHLNMLCYPVWLD